MPSTEINSVKKMKSFSPILCSPFLDTVSIANSSPNPRDEKIRKFSDVQSFVKKKIINLLYGE
jgi:hypothetical protein